MKDHLQLKSERACTQSIDVITTQTYPWPVTTSLTQPVTISINSN